MARPGSKPTTEDTDAKDETTKASSSSKSKDETPKSTSVLIMNRLGGFYVCNHVEQKTFAEGTAASADPRSRFEVTRVKIPPGLYLASPDEWSKLEAAGGFKKKVAGHDLVVLTDGDDWVADWNDMRARVKLDYVGNTAHESTLRALLEVESSADVADAIELQISALSEDGANRDAARKAQRAHNRAKPRRGRNARLLG